MLQKYIEKIKAYKKLSHDEEIALAVRIQNGDKKAEEKLISANLLYVVSVCTKYKGQGLSLDELISAGNLGIVEAAKRYDPKLNFKFITYARHWIKQQILISIFDSKYVYRVPLNYSEELNKYKKALGNLSKAFNREPTDAELMKELNIDESKLKLLAELEYSLQSVSIYDKSSDDGDYRYIDMIEDDNSNTEEELVDRNRSEILEKALDCLNEREKGVIVMLYGIHNDRLTLAEIADVYGFSVEMIRLIREKAIEKLKRSKYKEILHEYY